MPRFARSLPLCCCLAFFLAAASPVYSQSESLSWAGCGISKLSFMGGLAKAYKEQTGVEIHLTGGGATYGIRAVGAGKIDLGGSCRHALNTPEEQNETLIPIAWDALVIVVHPDNPIDDIQHEQLAAVYSGELTEWNQLGPEGMDGSVHVYAREGKNSGVGYMSRIMLFSDPDREYSATHVFPSTGPLEQALEADRLGIALTGISSALRRQLKILSFDGITPSRETLMAGTYRFARPLFLVVPNDYAKNSRLNDFVTWARSEAGQSAIQNTGAVAIRDITPETWERYFEFMSRAKQDLTALQKILSDLAPPSE